MAQGQTIASCSACHELLCSRAFLFIVLRSAQLPQIPRFLQIFRGIWPMLLSLLNHSALALFAQRTCVPTSARSIGFCVIWVCISSSSSSSSNETVRGLFTYENDGKVNKRTCSGCRKIVQLAQSVNVTKLTTKERHSANPYAKQPSTEASITLTSQAIHPNNGAAKKWWDIGHR